MRIVERKHHIDITIRSGSDYVLPVLRKTYPDICVIDDDEAFPYEGSELKEKLDDNWKQNPNLRINALRWAKGMTQQQLAEATGLNRVVISQLETGKREISLSIAKKLAPALGCSYKDLL
ncbi:MAG: helix-turn-helix transcriptional regulator [Spirochaetales bacterium]|nr:helix-turn-helix transcriptional regulator [Spirochaetales bacterium]MBR6348335.1 helix-turn-helix transcriptional regulator [Spirochaetales bacterium]